MLWQCSGHRAELSRELSLDLRPSIRKNGFRQSQMLKPFLRHLVPTLFAPFRTPTLRPYTCSKPGWKEFLRIGDACWPISMADLSPDTVAFWVSRDITNEGYRPLLDTTIEVLTLRLAGKSAEECA